MEVVKSVIQNLIAYNPSLPIYTVKDLMTIGLQGHLSSVELYQYPSEDVARLNNKIPLLLAAQGTAKLHDFLQRRKERSYMCLLKIFLMRRVEKLP